MIKIQNYFHFVPIINTTREIILIIIIIWSSFKKFHFNCLFVFKISHSFSPKKNLFNGYKSQWMMQKKKINLKIFDSISRIPKFLKCNPEVFCLSIILPLDTYIHRSFCVMHFVVQMFKSIDFIHSISFNSYICCSFRFLNFFFK